LRSKTFASLLIILLLSGSITVARSANKEQYAFRSIYIFENRGEEAYALTEEDATMVLFLGNRWQTVTLRNASHRILREDIDEDGNSLAIMDMLEDIPAGNSMIFSIEYVVESEVKPLPRIDPLEAGNLWMITAWRRRRSTVPRTWSYSPRASRRDRRRSLTSSSI
jgi:hypothetical protein